MGTFNVDGTVQSIRPSKKPMQIRKLPVDTGSGYTWIDEHELRGAGVTVRKRDLRFVMANGQTVTRSTGYAILRVGEFETVDEVVFGQPGDLQLLGARTLEGFPAAVDARRKRLVAAGPMPAA
ncbi:MAG: hypothetical protein COZ06_24915 [Armatimonadetes bacterium CG_4_10_14_3_um_filter_66_18]|nr:hypothetical protein [Armatimonadota bacterium]OIP07565.1 MAG: hypothetical protein AUJ96_07080 [Armatimonadetes bacterium CG2_30_66_41]PIU93888.1 MAG: hypothetical protein COS65_10490 [Armatimonadetes bacterium CG06_land_8_20_14_3_00_66_21]PIW21082.1 MAG: hypothetical protein COW34_00385 [Armatimonadetes bacterium CG17_big_fil_post_rev_8_21_14_2_50_66_6]PIX41063.1 MAG: hypothetical protein COZ57_24390 [Armatimonadetes bacterium CG_4_8_14_3_um_filter_66_20]PIY42583.1 MAG: hypothetical prote